MLQWLQYMSFEMNSTNHRPMYKPYDLENKSVVFSVLQLGFHFTASGII
jgi:hypothetical protein